jgi:hypothetical protein
VSKDFFTQSLIFRVFFSLGTFKVKKTVFQDEGYDLTRITEPIYYLNQQKQIYERLTSEIYNLIIKEKLKF